MILEALITLLSGGVITLLAGLPNLSSVPTGVSSAITSITPILGQVNSILPIDQALIALSLYLTIQFAILGVKLIEWALSKVLPTGQMKLPF